MEKSLIRRSLVVSILYGIPSFLFLHGLNNWRRTEWILNAVDPMAEAAYRQRKSDVCWRLEFYYHMVAIKAQKYIQGTPTGRVLKNDDMGTMYGLPLASESDSESGLPVSVVHPKVIHFA